MGTETPNFETPGLALVECDIDPNLCPVRRLRMNSSFPLPTYTCQHPNTPKIEDKILSRSLIFRTCVTKQCT